ncbi:hypothetical protein N0V90_010214 [Kalmusia sp. IMI 367209]|nr:hypothetical protein N0V90_010214 [Kalmusia sp. IMI 367209]
MSSNKKISKQLSGKVLTVAVGESEKKHDFVVHEELICESSEFFRKAMSGSWKESEDRVISLREDDPEIFGVYLQAVYKFKNGHIVIDNWDNHYSMVVWAQVFVLAEKLMDIGTKNIVIKEFFHMRDDLWEACITAGRAAQIIYDNTPGPCGLRQLFVDSAVYAYHCPHSDTNDFLDAMKNAPREFLQDLALAVVTKKVEVFDCEPLCSCPNTNVFFDYAEKYFESKDVETGETKDVNGKEKNDMGKGECKHTKDCCLCCKINKRVSAGDWDFGVEVESEIGAWV